MGIISLGFPARAVLAFLREPELSEIVDWLGVLIGRNDGEFVVVTCLGVHVRSRTWVERARFAEGSRMSWEIFAGKLDRCRFCRRHVWWHGLLVAVVRYLDLLSLLSSEHFYFRHLTSPVIEHCLDGGCVEVRLSAVADVGQSVPFVHTEFSHADFDIQSKIILWIHTTFWQMR